MWTLAAATFALPLLLGVPTHEASPIGRAPAIDLPASNGIPRSLADASQAERDTLDLLRRDEAWVRRAIAAERFARYDCPMSGAYIDELLADRAWQVRCYALLAAARRGIELPASRLAAEREPRVLRTALRCRFQVDAEVLLPIIERLESSAQLESKMLALELAVATSIDAKRFDSEEVLRTIVFRMGRAESGSLSPRLAAITSGRDSGRSYRWREWFRKNRRTLGLHGGTVVDEGGPDRERGPIAELASDRFVELVQYMQDLSGREIDLAILIDCTASMSGEIAECQSGIDALMLFAQGVAKDLRVAVVGYRDRRDDWETKGWDFTRSLDDARDRLWDLSAEGGGDRPESVSAALKLAYGRLAWISGRAASAILIGDAPPHPGTGEQCVDAARRARSAGITTYAIAPRADATSRRASRRADAPSELSEPFPEPSEVDGPIPANRPGLAPWWGPKRRPEKPESPWRRKLAPGEVEYFAEIAAAGGGRAVNLPRDASLIAEIAGLTLGDRFDEEFEAFFASWMALCR